VGFILVVDLEIFEYWAGFERSNTFFYLTPIFLVAWFAEENLGLVISVAITISCFLTDYADGLI